MSCAWSRAVKYPKKIETTLSYAWHFLAIKLILCSLEHMSSWTSRLCQASRGQGEGQRCRDDAKLYSENNEGFQGLGYHGHEGFSLLKLPSAQAVPWLLFQGNLMHLKLPSSVLPRAFCKLVKQAASIFVSCFQNILSFVYISLLHTRLSDLAENKGGDCKTGWKYLFCHWEVDS